MPLAFPSHPGLLAPLVERYSSRLVVTDVWFGAMAPDIFDGVANLVARGHLGQWMGHSLIGTLAFSTPLALVLAWLSRRLAAFGARRLGPETRVARWCAWLVAIHPRPLRSLGASIGSALLGAVSHVFFDLVSHNGSMLLWPFRDDPAWFGAAWHTAWVRVTVPGYTDYPIGPPFVVWIALSVVGAVLFFRYLPRRDVLLAGRAGSIDPSAG